MKKNDIVIKCVELACRTANARHGSGIILEIKSGDVVTKDCVDKIIKPDMVHPLTGAKLEKSDLIELARGGTGYSSSNEILTAKSYRPSLAIN